MEETCELVPRTMGKPGEPAIDQPAHAFSPIPAFNEPQRRMIDSRIISFNPRDPPVEFEFTAGRSLSNDSYFRRSAPRRCGRSPNLLSDNRLIESREIFEFIGFGCRKLSLPWTWSAVDQIVF